MLGNGCALTVLGFAEQPIFKQYGGYYAILSEQNRARTGCQPRMARSSTVWDRISAERSIIRPYDAHC